MGGARRPKRRAAAALAAMIRRDLIASSRDPANSEQPGLEPLSARCILAVYAEVPVPFSCRPVLSPFPPAASSPSMRKCLSPSAALLIGLPDRYQYVLVKEFEGKAGPFKKVEFVLPREVKAREADGWTKTGDFVAVDGERTSVMFDSGNAPTDQDRERAIATAGQSSTTHANEKPASAQNDAMRQLELAVMDQLFRGAEARQGQINQAWASQAQNFGGFTGALAAAAISNNRLQLSGLATSLQNKIEGQAETGRRAWYWNAPPSRPLPPPEG